MSRPLAVLRPEPGNAATAARIVAAGQQALRLPLFAVRPLDWIPPGAEAHDALILTSANAVRHAGDGLAALADLPAFAVGAATAAAARQAGLQVVAVGPTDAAALGPLLAVHDVRRGLHLAGHERTPTALAGVTRTIAVYASEPLTPPPGALAALAGSVVLVHSPRAARRLAALIDVRGAVRVAAISAAAADAAGGGWARLVVADRPTDAALVAAAIGLAD